jgi:hypothetical protein
VACPVAFQCDGTLKRLLNFTCPVHPITCFVSLRVSHRFLSTIECMSLFLNSKFFVHLHLCLVRYIFWFLRSFVNAMHLAVLYAFSSNVNFSSFFHVFAHRLTLQMRHTTHRWTFESESNPLKFPFVIRLSHFCCCTTREHRNNFFICFSNRFIWQHPSLNFKIAF